MTTGLLSAIGRRSSIVGGQEKNPFWYFVACDPPDVCKTVAVTSLPTIPTGSRPSLLPLAAVGGAVLLVLLGRSAELQLSRREAATRALARARQQVTVTPAQRGRILDRTGVVLAEDRPERVAVVVPSELQGAQRKERFFQAIRPEGGALAQLEGRLGAPHARRFVLRRGLSEEAASELRGVPGVHLKLGWRRHYPLPFASVLGYVGLGDPLDDGGHTPGGRVGKAGVERRFDHQLRGTAGRLAAPSTRLVKDEPTAMIPPVPGEDLTLTLDQRIQWTAVRELRNARISTGAVVVMDPSTGALLASVSLPFVDPGELAAGHAANTPGDRPWVDRTRKNPQPPGSLVAPFLVLAGASQGPLSSHTCRGFFHVGHRIFSCSHVHGRLDAGQALAEGCHVFSYELALALGSGALPGALRNAGMIGPVDAPLGEPEWIYPTEAALMHPVGINLATSIGHGGLGVTPLGVAVAYSALANGGRVLAPRIDAASPVAERGLLPAREQLPLVRKALVERARPLFAKRDPDETSQLLADLAGAEAPAQVKTPRGEIEWFVGFAPAAAPRVLVVVLSEDGRRHAASQAGVEVIAAALQGDRPPMTRERQDPADLDDDQEGDQP